eukprot:6368401-Prymnesium_polylepis.1
MGCRAWMRCGGMFFTGATRRVVLVAAGAIRTTELTVEGSCRVVTRAAADGICSQGLGAATAYGWSRFA